MRRLACAGLCALAPHPRGRPAGRHDGGSTVVRAAQPQRPHLQQLPRWRDRHFGVQRLGGGRVLQSRHGRRWIVQPSPSVGVSANHLYGVAATSASSAWAVGSYRGISRTLILYRG
jgi:hypothetical protein